jgi:25S rRNA (adenine2142-N1)-methyltransferase
MAKHRKPIPLVPPKLKSLKRAREVTSKFHRITHAIAGLETQAKSDKVKEQIKTLHNELEELGGREVYQQASVLTTARCSSTKWVTKVLRRRGFLTSSKSSSSSSSANEDGSNPIIPRVLEVGAINTELLSTKGLNVRSIDILSRDPRIEQCDFFSLEKDLDSNSIVPYEVIVCSMVINCVPNPQGK